MNMAEVKVEKAETNTRDTPKSNRGKGGGSRRGHVSTAKLIGNYASISKYVYDIVHGQTDWFTKTAEAIAEYVGEEYTHGSDNWLAIETLHLLTITETPEEATKDAKGNLSKFSEFMWQEEARDYIKTKQLINQSIKRTYSQIWGQCDEKCGQDLKK